MPAESNDERLRRLFKILYEQTGGGEFDLADLVKRGVLTESDADFLRTNLPNPATEEPSPDPTMRLGQLLTKINTYQRLLSVDRPVELNVLIRENVLNSDDIEFIKTHDVTYKPHRLADYHSMDMFHMPTEGGGCVFIGPGGPPLKKRTTALKDFQRIIESFLNLPNPDLLLHIEITEKDGAAVGAGILLFHFQSQDWKDRAEIVREAGGRVGVSAFQDYEVQNHRSLSFKVEESAALATLTVKVLQDGCGFNPESQITYSAGALDVLENG
jgi:hypothetical protein